MPAPFNITSFARGVGVVTEKSSDVRLAVRRPVVIQAASEDFRKYRLPRAMRLSTVSVAIYNDPGYWALLAEWNNLPSPAQYLVKYLPSGYEIRYLDTKIYEAYRNGQRRFSLAGYGDVDLSVTLPSMAVTSTTPDDGILDVLEFFESLGFEFFEFGGI